MDGEWIKDLFAEFGAVQVRPMFGGQGIFADDTMIGLCRGDTVYLRTDATSRADMMAEGSQPFRFDKPSMGKTVTTAFYALPLRLYDEPDALAEFARRALGAARVTRARKARPGAGRGAGRR